MFVVVCLCAFGLIFFGLGLVINGVCFCRDSQRSEDLVVRGFVLMLVGGIFGLVLAMFPIWFLGKINFFTVTCTTALVIAAVAVVFFIKVVRCKHNEDADRFIKGGLESLCISATLVLMAVFCLLHDGVLQN
jgi:high-affinity Fe2+/Pb2+ permease